MFDDYGGDDVDNEPAFGVGYEDNARTVEVRPARSTDHREYMTVLTGRMSVVMALQVLQTVAQEGKLPVAVVFDEERFSIAARGRTLLWARVHNVSLSLGCGKVTRLPSVEGLVALYLIARTFASETLSVRFEYVADYYDDGSSIELERAILEYCLLLDQERL